MIDRLRRHATTIALTALAAGLGVYVVWLDRDSVSTGEAELRKKNLLPAWRADDLEEIRIERGGQLIRFVRRAADEAGNRPWDVEIDGARHPAEEQVLFDQLLGTLEFATFDRAVPPDSVDRAAFGLDAPSEKITIRMGELEMVLSVGGETPASPGSRYAEVAGRGVYVISKALAEHLAVDPQAYRAKGVVPYLVMDVSALSLDGEGGPRRFVRAAWAGGRGAGFRFDGSTPEGDVRASALVLDTVFVSLGQMQATRFLPLAEAEAALEARVTISMTPKDGRPPALLEIGGACPSDESAVVVVRRAPEPLGACVRADVLPPLVRPAQDFVDRGVVGAAFDEISAVILSKGGKTVDLARKGAAFTLRAPEERAIEGETGTAFLDGLLEIEGTIVPPGEAKGLTGSPGIARIQSYSESLMGSSERNEDIEIGEPDGEHTYVRRKEDGAVLRVATHEARRFEPSVIALRDRAVFAGPITDWASLTIEPAGGARQRVERSSSGGLDLVEPDGEGLAVDAGLTGDMVTFLGKLTAVRWVADAPDPSFGLSTPRLRVSLEAHEGRAPAPRQALAIGAATEGGFFAQVEGERAVFVAPAALVPALDRLVLSRDVMRVLGDDVRRVTLEEGSQRLLAVTGSGAWKLEGDGLPADADVRAGKLRDALADLRAEGAVSVGPPSPAQGLGAPRARITVEHEGDRRTEIAIGDSDVFRGVRVSFARRSGVDATYAVAQSRVDALLDLFW